MQPSKKSFSYFQEGPNEGEETEAEKQLKFLLKKQLTTKIDINEIFQNKKEFLSNATHVGITSYTKGKLTLSELLKIESEKEQKEYLQQLGLCEMEINLYLQLSNVSMPNKRSLIDPTIQKKQYQEILQKIEDKLNDRKTSETFAGAKMLNRQEMEIENSLYAGSKKELNYLRRLVTKTECESKLKDPDHPLNHLNEILDDVTRKKCAEAANENKQGSSSDFSLEFDPAVHNAAVLIPLSEISQNKLSLEEIKAMPRFTDYSPGVPSKTLFLKNLHPKISSKELIALFNHFQHECCEDKEFISIKYRLLCGKMKGQAFIKFPDLELAVKAYEAVNGYKLRNKPIIIQYGKS